MPWQVPNIWEEGECYIIGGGLSMPHQFGVPKEVVKLVLEKEATPDIYSPYLSELHDKHIIGVNAAFYIGNWIEVCFFGDAGFFLHNRKELADHPALKISTNAAVRGYRWVKYLKQSREKSFGITRKRTELVWGVNSGAAAINLAVHFGVKRIILLGFDLKMEGINSHWHSVYKSRDVKSQEHSFHRHLRSFPAIAKDAKRMGVEIINANPDSALTEFKRVSLKEIL